MNVAVTASPALTLIGRLLLASLFLIAGTREILAFAGTVGYLAKLGFPAPGAMAVIAIVIEIGGSILLIIGWRARWAAWLLMLFVLIATFAAHRFWEFGASQYNNQLDHFLKNIAILGGLLCVATFGPGSRSVDKA